MLRPAWILLPILFGFLGNQFTSTANAQTEPLETTICEINRNPEAYSGKALRVRGFVSSHFEDFTLHSKDCDRGTGIWLMYANNKSDMNYWARSAESTANTVAYLGESYPIVKDKSYDDFLHYVEDWKNDQPVYQVSANLTGKFFAITWKKYPSGQVLPNPGYGHLGCCHLFIITAVSAVTPIPQDHSDIRGIVHNPSGEPLKDVSVEGYLVGRTKNPVSKTGKSGRFRFPDTDSDLTITKDGFLPVILVLDSTIREYNVTLRPLTEPDWIVPDCKESDWNADSVGDHWRFQLPHGAQPLGIPNWKSFKPVDFVSVPFGSDGTALMLHRSPFPEGLDIPYYLLRDLSQSDFRWIRDARGRIVGADVRGTLDDGAHQRIATFVGFGEASYSRVSADASSYFDKIITSVCYARQ
jgi:hypothetical protein